MYYVGDVGDGDGGDGDGGDDQKRKLVDGHEALAKNHGTNRTFSL